jgi:hypothetical protein
MSVSIDTTLNVVNEAGRRTRALLDLITSNIGFIRAGYLGHKPIGTDDLVFPCVMIDVVDSKAHMYTTGKYDVSWTINIYFYVVESNRDDLVTKQTETMEALIKLLSNKALDDALTTHTNQYKTYPGYWLDSEMTSIHYSGTFAWTRPDKAQWARAGLMTVELMDRVTK